MAELLLIARLAGRRIAFPADKVEAVVELEGITPAPCAAAHVAGLAALRSRVLTVIDGLAALELGRGREDGALDAIVVPWESHTYALVVDEVEDVVEADGPHAALAAPVGTGWDRVAIGTVAVSGELFLLIDPYLLIAGPAAQAA